MTYDNQDFVRFHNFMETPDYVRFTENLVKLRLCLQPIDDNTVETVSARELHSFLESRQDFSTWIKKRISEYDFTVNQDFTTVSKNLENGGRY